LFSLNLGVYKFVDNPIEETKIITNALSMDASYQVFTVGANQTIAAGNYYLDEDLQYQTKAYKIAEDTEVTICLNGQNMNCVFEVYGKLTVFNNSENGAIQMQADNVFRLHEGTNLLIQDVDITCPDAANNLIYLGDTSEIPLSTEVNIINCNFTGKMSFAGNGFYTEGTNKVTKRLYYFKDTTIDTSENDFITSSGEYVFENCDIKHTPSSQPHQLMSTTYKDAFIFDCTNGNNPGFNFKFVDCNIHDTEVFYATFQSMNSSTCEFKGSTTFTNVGSVFSHVYVYDYSISKDYPRIILKDNRTNKTAYNIDHIGFEKYNANSLFELEDCFYIKTENTSDLQYINSINYLDHFVDSEVYLDNAYFVYRLRTIKADADTVTATTNSKDVEGTYQWYERLTTTKEYNPTDFYNIYDSVFPYSFYHDYDLERVMNYNSVEKSYEFSKWHYEGQYSDEDVYALGVVVTNKPAVLSYQVKGSDITYISEDAMDHTSYILDDDGNQKQFTYGEIANNDKIYTYCINFHSAVNFTFVNRTAYDLTIYNLTLTEIEDKALENQTTKVLSNPTIGSKYFITASYTKGEITYKTTSNIITYTKVFDPISIDENVQTYTYGDSNIKYDIKGTNKDLDGYEVSYYVDDAWTTTVPTNAGTYNVKVTRTSDSTYASYEKEITGGLVINKLAVNEPTSANYSYAYTGSLITLELSGVEEYMSTNDDPYQTNIGTYTVTYTLDDNHTWASGSDGVITWKINQKEISSENKEGEKPVVKVDSNNGIEENITVEVEITVEAQVETTKLTVDYYNIINDNPNIKLKDNEVVGVVFDVKLYKVVNDVKTQIQPSDLEGVNSINVRMLIPEEVDIDKVTRILHVHTATDIEEITFNKDLIDEEGYYQITISRLSEFAFIYENETNVNPTGNVCLTHWLLFLLLIALIGFVGVLWIFLGIRKFKKDNELQLAPVIGFSLHLVLLVVISIFAKCGLCVVLIVLNAIALIASIALYLFKEKIQKQVNEKILKKEETVEEDVSLKESIEVASKAVNKKVEINKKTVADYLENKYKENVVVNRRNNYIASGYLPLADTHYKVLNGKKVCFIYVYELNNGSTFFLVKAKEELYKNISKSHGGLRKSAFPISTNTKWYSMIIDETYKSSKDVFEVIDMIYENN